LKLLRVTSLTWNAGFLRADDRLCYTHTPGLFLAAGFTGKACRSRRLVQVGQASLSLSPLPSPAIVEILPIYSWYVRVGSSAKSWIFRVCSLTRVFFVAFPLTLSPARAHPSPGLGTTTHALSWTLVNNEASPPVRDREHPAVPRRAQREVPPDGPRGEGGVPQLALLQRETRLPRSFVRLLLSLKGFCWSWCRDCQYRDDGALSPSPSFLFQ